MVKHSGWIELATLVALVACGAAARLALHEQFPNFAPVAALALFAGFFLRDWRAAVCVPLCIMAISDLVIGPYSAVVMAVVYGSIALPVIAGPWLRRWLRLEQPTAVEAASSAGIIYGCSLLGACFFYLTTNGAEWAVDCFRPQPTYAANIGGLVHCLAQGLPFFKYTLLGDLCFATAFFGLYAAAVNLGWLIEREPSESLEEVGRAS